MVCPAAGSQEQAVRRRLRAFGFLREDPAL